MIKRRLKLPPIPPADWRHRSHERSPLSIVPFPCIRCGKLGVPVSVLSFILGTPEHTFGCRLCNAEHYVGVSYRDGRLAIAYDRYTRRYPLEAYDEGLPLAVVTMGVGTASASGQDGDAPFGPILVNPRKRRFSVGEVNAVWKASGGRCHICKKPWALSKRGRIGWHIDHVIPHIGGGADTEVLRNLKVACAKCNLQRGRGYCRSSVEASIRLLMQHLQRPQLTADESAIDRRIQSTAGRTKS